VTADIMLAQLEKYCEVRDWDFIKKINGKEDDDMEAPSMSRKFYWQDGEPFFAFSKYKGRALSWVIKEDYRFVRWMLSADLSEESKEVVRRAIARVRCSRDRCSLPENGDERDY
jgi:hypothetical protein